MTAIIDTNHDVMPHLAGLKAAGVRTVIRYLNPINPRGEKCVKPTEARAIAASGLRLALVCEGWGDFAHGAISAGAGERDGEWCAAYASTLGAPDGTAIFYAIDVDADDEQIKTLVLPYFEAIAAKHSDAAVNYRRGVYGSGNVLTAVTGAGLAELAWLSCSLGWRGSRECLASNKWMLRQHAPTLLCGIDCDPNEASGNFGDFVPFATQGETHGD
jgi:Rv2525c-like, glycoside hydrolase-like domain